MDKEAKELEEIIKKNLEIMNSYKKGGMGYQGAQESIGGNAGPNSVATNFYFDNDTGRIIEFTNEVDYDKKYGAARYVIKLSFEKVKVENHIEIKVTRRIEELQFKTNASNNAKEILKECMRIYNQQQNEKEGQ